MKVITKNQSDWFFEVSALKKYDLVKTNVHTSRDRIYNAVAMQLQRDLKKLSLGRKYYGDILGDRSERVARVENNVIGWLEDMSLSYLYSESATGLKMNVYSRSTDVYGNPRYVLIVDLVNYANYCGRILVDLQTILVPLMTSTRFRRYMVAKFPSFIDPLNETYETSFDIVARIWFNPIRFIDLTCFRIPVYNNILVPMKGPDDERDNYHKRIHLFTARNRI